MSDAIQALAAEISAGMIAALERRGAIQELIAQDIQVEINPILTIGGRFVLSRSLQSESLRTAQLAGPQGG